MQYELSDEEIQVLVAGLNTIPVQGTDAMRKVIALEDKLKAAQEKKE